MVEKEIRVYTADVEMTTLVVRPVGSGPCRSRWSICTGVAMKQDPTAVVSSEEKASALRP